MFKFLSVYVIKELLSQKSDICLNIPFFYFFTNLNDADRKWLFADFSIISQPILIKIHIYM